MLELKHITKTFDTDAGRVKAVDDVSLTINPGEIFGIIGFSGAGKSTLVRCINLLERPTSGNVVIDGTDLTTLFDADLRVVRRRIGMIFQHFNLMPSRTVFDNIALALRHSELGKEAKAKKIEELLALVGLSDKSNAYPAQLSGGQKQRVALARALAVEPQILLLDEPFGALDAQVRKELRRWLRQLHEELKFTSVFVTHDQEEATEVADRVVVMSQGNIEQADAPNQVWREPATRFVLEFMGEVNRLQGTIRGGQFHVGAHRWPLGYTPAYQGPVDLFLRPWEVDISRRTSLDSPLPVQVLEASPKGHYTQLVVQPLGWYNEPLTVVMHGDDAPQRGERLFVGLQHARLYNGDERIETRDEELALAQSA